MKKIALSLALLLAVGVSFTSCKKAEAEPAAVVEEVAIEAATEEAPAVEVAAEAGEVVAEEGEAVEAAAGEVAAEAVEAVTEEAPAAEAAH